MLKRLIKLPQQQSFFLFGARGTGKSTLLNQLFTTENSLLINLLLPETENRFALNPSELTAIVKALPEKITHIIIDEVQKVPQLLNVVHFLIENTAKHFVLTGSSARKLKHGGANLLAGRAFVYNLFPFSFLEIGEKFSLDLALHWGMLPKIHSFNNDEDKINFLQSYTNTYLKEEIWGEHFINKLEPFRKFLEVAGQTNGKIISYANIARDVGADDKTVKEYFNLLEDTLLGFFLEPFQHSFRKRLGNKPKFYFFDCGVVRSLTRTLTLPLQKSTSNYGDIFEHFIILECIKLAAYYKSEYRFSYLRTKDDAEVDLIVERPGLPLLFIEIKSSENVRQTDVSQLATIAKDFGHCEALCLSNDPYAKQYGNVSILPWQEGIKKFFTN